MEVSKVRIDKWLWSVRIFKTRTVATDACKSGKVLVNESSVKPSYITKQNEILTVKKNGFNFQYKVIELIDKRVGSPIALTCYEDITPADELKKFEAWFLAGKKGEFREKGTGRPTKKDRRLIDTFKTTP
ncbi:MAG TPA: RNA-binding S4 domain-containing protein [Saprospiraceae bacterium]|nr:RNA-binding S4 domain-containing protein [Saprospiraceae bacterium]